MVKWSNLYGMNLSSLMQDFLFRAHLTLGTVQKLRNPIGGGGGSPKDYEILQKDYGGGGMG